MICDNCNGNIVINTNQKYHYVMCGLDNIYLENIKTEVCESCGQVTPYIPKITLLHKVIATILVLKPKSLTGKEMRFLRKERRKKAKDWAALLGVEPDTLSCWENEEKQPSRSLDHLIRLLYCRVFEEQENQLFKEHLLEHFSNLVEEENTSIPQLYINAMNPEQYRYVNA